MNLRFKTLLLAAIVAGISTSANLLHAQTFALKSADLAPDTSVPNKFVFKGFGCTGDNISPSLTWTNAPAGTKSFAITVHDPDAPTGGAGFWHWIVVNVPAGTTEFAQNAGAADGKKLPKPARHINTDFGSPGWGGPCPPKGDKPHQYNFTVYAIKVEKLDLPAKATASLAGFMINANALGKASFTALYGR
jgi:Raf kinase inhibitor-like YbhB/YbcL family protein